MFRRSGAVSGFSSGLRPRIADTIHRLKDRKCGTVFSILSLLVLLAVISAPLYLSHKSDSRTGAPLHVSASVMRRQVLEILFQAPTVTLKEEDLNRGYVEMTAATRLSIYNNDKNGCLLHFRGLEPPFGKALISGLGSEVQVGATDAFVYQEYRKGTVTRTLNYKLYPLDDTRPGEYAWPLTIALDEAIPR